MHILLNQHQNYVVASVDETGKVEIRSSLLRKQMQNEGIMIPGYKQDQFRHLERIKLTDELFSKAFMEVHYPSNMDNKIYVWMKEEGKKK